MHNLLCVKANTARMMAKVLRAIANPTRLLILDALRRSDRCVCDLNKLFRISQPTLSRHLARLKNAGIVTDYRQGLRVMHRLEMPAVLKTVEAAAAVLTSDAARRSHAVREL